MTKLIPLLLLSLAMPANAATTVHPRMSRSDTVNVKDCGAKGDGITDDTAAILGVIAAAPAGATVLFPKGTYVVASTLYVPSNITLRGRGAVLKFSNTALYDSLLRLDHVTNVIIEGFELDGQKASVPGVTEYKHGVYVLSSTHVELRDLYSHGHKGDGVYIGAEAAQASSADVNGTNLRLDANHRMGLTVAALDGGRFMNVRGTNNAGTDPQAGLDIEPNADDQTIRDLDFIGCEFSGNAKAGINIFLRSAPTAVQRGIRFTGCSSRANGSVGVYLQNPAGVSFAASAIESNTTWGVDWESSGRDVSFTDTTIRLNGERGVGILPKNGDTATGITFTDARIGDNGQTVPTYGVNIDPAVGGAVTDVSFIGTRFTGATHTYGLRTGSTRVTNLKLLGNVFTDAAIAQALLGDDGATRQVFGNQGISGASYYWANALDFPSVASGASASLDVTIAGLVKNDFVKATINATLPGGVVLSAAVVDNAGLVRVSLLNLSGAPYDPVSLLVWVVGEKHP
jgi:hypothetical protein